MLAMKQAFPNTTDAEVTSLLFSLGPELPLPLGSLSSDFPSPFVAASEV